MVVTETQQLTLFAPLSCSTVTFRTHIILAQEQGYTDGFPFQEAVIGWGLPTYSLIKDTMFCPIHWLTAQTAETIKFYHHDRTLRV